MSMFPWKISLGCPVERLRHSRGKDQVLVTCFTVVVVDLNLLIKDTLKCVQGKEYDQLTYNGQNITVSVQIVGVPMILALCCDC